MLVTLTKILYNRHLTSDISRLTWLKLFQHQGIFAGVKMSFLMRLYILQ